MPGQHDRGSRRRNARCLPWHADAERAAVEREFWRLKNEYGLTPLRTRGLRRVAQHADLAMIARLGQALVRARALPLAA